MAPLAVRLAYVLLLITTISMSGCIGSTNTYSPPTTTCRDVQVPYEAEEQYLKTEYYTETVPYADRECDNIKLVYKKDNDYCDNRAVLFGMTTRPALVMCRVSNLDTEKGDFYVEIGFNSGGKRYSVTKGASLYPQSSETFSYEYDVDASSCFCEVRVPTKQVCRDVTKYKDVQRTRQVTAYRPITKYKTERQCQ